MNHSFDVAVIGLGPSGAVCIGLQDHGTGLRVVCQHEANELLAECKTTETTR